MAEIYPASSPYANTKLFGDTFLDVLNYRPIPKNSSDSLFTITTQYEYRPDLLAQDLYSNSKLWWVFAARNPNVLGPDPYFNFKTGVKIYIPLQSQLVATLGV